MIFNAPLPGKRAAGVEIVKEKKRSRLSQAIQIQYNVWEEFCKAIIFQLKIKIGKKKEGAEGETDLERECLQPFWF